VSAPAGGVDPTEVRAAAVILAAGSGTRVGAQTNKVLLPLAGVPVLARSVRSVLDVEGIQRIVLVVRPQDREAVRAAVAPHLGAHDLWVVDGGEHRHDSELQALEALAGDIESGEVDVVAIHDAARPLARPDLWTAVLAAAHEHGGAIPVVATPRLSHRDGSAAPAGLVGVQTPQAFRARPLLEAYRQARADGFVGTDTAACLEQYAEVTVVGVPSTARNLKVTFPEDLDLAEQLLSAAPS
jgi:2-C-methyl-D-erythritol 4-phosphate cytidylyltransferase